MSKSLRQSLDEVSLEKNIPSTKHLSELLNNPLNALGLPMWLTRLINNLGVYLVAFAIGYVVLQNIKSKPEPDPSDPSFKAQIIRFFVYGKPELVPTEDTPTKKSKKEEDGRSESEPVESFHQTAIKLAFCVCGLLGSFLTWGLLQERIMTTEYSGGRFESANFTVFCSRTFGWFLAFLAIKFTDQKPLRAPFYQFSFTSFSNVMSSYCQLEALKFLSFPTQVLGKSSKMIPVMMMGKFLNNKKYPLYEYIIALVIIAGVATFMLAEKGGGSSEKTTSAAGLVLLGGYLTFDSFTSQWQSHLFKNYDMSSYQMMYGVNSFSASLTLLALLQTGEFFTSVAFLTSNLDCFRDILMFSVAGACGSMFIFYTIKTFGPLVFTMIMVTRQLFAIILSCVFYGHEIGAAGFVGASLVFGAIGYRTYRKNLDRQEAEARKLLSPSKREEVDAKKN